MAKQSGGGAETLVLPHDTKNRARGGSFGRTEGSKVSSLLGKYKETTQAAAAPSTGSSGQSPVGRFASKESESQWTKQLEEQTASVKEEEEGLTEDQAPANANAADAVDFEKEIESTLRVSDLVDRVHMVDLVDIPLSNNPEIAENGEEDESNEKGSRVEGHEVAEPLIEQQEDLTEKTVQVLEEERHQEQLEQATLTADEDLTA